MATATLSPPCPAAVKVIVESARAAVEATFSQIWGEAPSFCEHPPQESPTSCVAGIISFAGDQPWSLSWALARETAPALIQRFTGFEIPFDSPDMGEAVAELVNVLAGEVIVQMEKRRMKAKMGLPMVARGCPLELMASRSSAATRLDYTCAHGRFWIGVICAGQ